MSCYIVGGSQRMGTSMMMQALMAGGLEADFDPARNALNRNGDDHYRPNASGFCELSRPQYNALGFPRAHEGRLIKVLNEDLVRLVPGDYRVVFMRRDLEEARQSYEAFLKPPHPLWQWLGRRLTDAEARQRLDDLEGILRARRDCRVTTLWYRDVVENPDVAFMALWRDGWPIEIASAAATVDPALCRMRREELEAGI